MLPVAVPVPGALVLVPRGAGHPQPGLVHQGGGLERLMDHVPVHVGPGQAVQLALDLVVQRADRLAVALGGPVEGLGYVAGGVGGPRPFGGHPAMLRGPSRIRQLSLRRSAFGSRVPGAWSLRPPSERHP